MATLIRDEPKNITVARQVVRKAMCDTAVLVFTQAAGVTKVIPHSKVVRIHACMTTKGFMDVYPAASFILPMPTLAWRTFIITNTKKGGMFKMHLRK